MERQGSGATPVPGEIVGRWAEDHALIRLEDGRSFEVPTPAEVDGFDVGDKVLVYFDGDGSMEGWYLPDRGEGVDLRGSGGAREA